MQAQTQTHDARPEVVWDDFTITWMVELGLCGYSPPEEPRCLDTREDVDGSGSEHAMSSPDVLPPRRAIG